MCPCILHSEYCMRNSFHTFGLLVPDEDWKFDAKVRHTVATINLLSHCVAHHLFVSVVNRSHNKVMEKKLIRSYQ